MIRLILVLLFVVLFLLIACIPAFILWVIDTLQKKKAAASPEKASSYTVPSLKDRVSRKLIRFAFRSILFLSGVKVTAEGLENIPADTPVLYVGNHRGFFDIIASYTLFPGVTGFVAKKEMEKIPLLSLWMRYIRCLFLDRSNIKEGLKTILEGIELVKSGISLCIYPEGTRCRSEHELDMLEFKEGSLKIAEKSGCPVIPVAALHTADILENHFPFIHATHVTIRFGAPIDLKALSKEERKFSGAYVRGLISEMLTDMSKNEA